MNYKFFVLFFLQNLYVEASEKNDHTQSSHGLQHSLSTLFGPIRRGPQISRLSLDKDRSEFSSKQPTINPSLSGGAAQSSEHGLVLKANPTRRSFSAVTRNRISHTDQNKDESSTVQSSSLVYHSLPNKTLFVSQDTSQETSNKNKDALVILPKTEKVSSPKNDGIVSESLDLVSKNKRLKALEEKLDVLARDTHEERAAVFGYLNKIITFQERMEQMFVVINKNIESMDTKIKSLETKIDAIRTNTASK